MPDMLASFLWGYGAVGLVVGLAFVLIGWDRVDPAAHGAYAVRPLLLPGFVILWPIIALRWAMLERMKARRP